MNLAANLKELNINFVKSKSKMSEDKISKHGDLLHKTLIEDEELTESLVYGSGYWEQDIHTYNLSTSTN